MCQSNVFALLVFFLTEKLNIFSGLLETLQLLFYILEIQIGVRYEKFTDVPSPRYTMGLSC